MDNQNQNQTGPTFQTANTDDNQPIRPAFQTIEQPADTSPFATTNSPEPAPETSVPPPSGFNPPIVTEETAAPPVDGGNGNKFSKKTMFAGIITVLVLTVGLIGGVLLVRQPQDIREQAASGSECNQAPDCILLDNPGNQGTYSTSEQIKYIDITAKDYHRYNPGENDDGCYRVSIAGKNLSWERIGSGPNCKDISNIQIWLTQEQSTSTPTASPTSSPTASPTSSPTSSPTGSPTTTPTSSPTSSPTASPTGSPGTIVARCSEIKAYDEDWVQLSYQELAQLSSGDIVRFAVSGISDSGTFDKARFNVNGVQRAEVTQLKPGSQEFYDEYVIPAGSVNFTVDAEVHHVELNKWY